MKIKVEFECEYSSLIQGNERDDIYNAMVSILDKWKGHTKFEYKELRVAEPGMVYPEKMEKVHGLGKQG